MPVASTGMTERETDGARACALQSPPIVIAVLVTAILGGAGRGDVAWMPVTSTGMTGRGNRAPMKGGWVYIMTNRPNGTLYVGVTNDLGRRAWEHRTGRIEGFTRRYGLKRLVWAERHDDIRTAIRREKTMKHWPRAWKVRLILAANPQWQDLYDRIA